MSYNSVCLLQEFFQVLNSEYVWLDWASIVTSQGFVEDGNKVHSVSGINIVSAWRTTRSTEITRVSQARVIVLDRKVFSVDPFKTWHKKLPFSRQNDVERSDLNSLYSLIIS